MLEKQRATNNMVYLVGAVVAALGLLTYFMNLRALGIVLLIVGVAIFMIAVSISNFFFRLDTHELFSGKKK